MTVLAERKHPNLDTGLPQKAPCPIEAESESALLLFYDAKPAFDTKARYKFNQLSGLSFSSR